MADSGNTAMNAGLSALASTNPYAAAAVAVYGLIKGRKKPKLMSYGKALNIAKEQINPEYTQSLQRALGALNTSSAVRGVSGQDRTNQQMAGLISDSEAQRASAAARLAQQIRTNQNNQNMANFQLEQERNQTMQGGLTDLLRALSRNGTQTVDWNTIFNKSSVTGTGGTASGGWGNQNWDNYLNDTFKIQYV